MTPRYLYVAVPGLAKHMARLIASDALLLARQRAPKLSGEAAQGMRPVYGEGHYGLSWQHDYLWYQEAGISPFTMRSLAGKMIPMWVEDPRGEERRKNPKIKTRRTVSGKVQVLIFRKAAPIGSRKTVRRPLPGGGSEMRSVPRSYPGAPGRISVREAGGSDTTVGKVAGAIAKGNVGVRWRHPGLASRGFMAFSLQEAGRGYGIAPGPVVPSRERWR
jgi:hypothetical protein